MAAKLKPLWKCPRCGERFVGRNMWHSCGRFSLRSLFARSDPKVAKLFRKFARMVRSCGPVHMIPQKSRVAFQVRVRFAGAIPHKSWLQVGFWFTHRYEDPRFYKIEKIPPHYYVYSMRIESEADLDAHLQRWLRRAYLVGQQKHLERGDL